MNFDNIFLFNWTSITGYFHPVVVDILPKNISILFDDCITASRSVLQFIGDHLSCPIEFTDLQIVLLCIFLSIISVNIVLIAYYWSKYGDVITDRFIRPSEYRGGCYESMLSRHWPRPCQCRERQRTTMTHALVLLSARSANGLDDE